MKALPQKSIDKYSRRYFSETELLPCRDLGTRRELSPRAILSIQCTIDAFIKDKGIDMDDVILAGSVSTNTFIDIETKHEQPEWYKDCYYCKTIAGNKFKYSDIDLTIPNRPDLKGMYMDYGIKIDVGNFCNVGCVSYREWLEKHTNPKN